MKIQRVWRGKSGQEFCFDVDLTGQNAPNAAGVYMFVRRRAMFWLTPLYIGNAKALRQNLSTNMLWPKAWWTYGATERHFLLLDSEEEQLRVKKDLVQRLKPAMNREPEPAAMSLSPPPFLKRFNLENMGKKRA